MTDVPVVLSKYQYPIIERLKAEGTFGSEDAEIIKRVFLQWCRDNGITPKRGVPDTKFGRR